MSFRRGPRRGSSRAFVSTSLALSALFASVACHGEADEARRADVARVSEAVRKLRDAPNDAKRPLLLALQQTPCVADDALKLRKSCSDAYEPLVAALDEIGAVRFAMQNGASEPPDVTLLRRSQSHLKEAETRTKACADLEGTTKRRYSIP